MDTTRPTANEQLVTLDESLKERLQFGALLAELSAHFINLATDRVDSEIQDAQRRICESLGIDLLAFWHLSNEDPVVLTATHYYSMQTGPQPPEQLKQEDFPWYVKQMQAGRIVGISSLEELPAEAGHDREVSRQLGVKSNLSIPLSVESGSLIGVLGLNTTQAERDWPDELVNQLQQIGQIFANALARKRAEQALKNRLQFEGIVSSLSARFLAIPYDQFDSAIDCSLREIMEFFQVDRCALMEVGQDNSFAGITHAAFGDSIEPISGETNLAQLFPWSVEQLRKSGDINIYEVEDYPEDALTDRQSHNALGIKSSISVPVAIDDGISRVIVIHHMRDYQTWPEEYIVSLRLLGEIIFNAIERKQDKLKLEERLIEIESLKERLERENIFLQEEVGLLIEHNDIVGQSFAIKNVLALARQVAQTDSTVLILGETGTGKERLARAIHNMSLRKDRPLVTVNCTSLPVTLIESELFGREKGAYTGAMTKMVGRFEIADESTLFLDEIGEFPPEIQSKLLRVLEQGKFERLGSTQPLHADVRIIAATNRDLDQDVKTGKFRQDLFYRLNVFPIVIPPLRERPDDIPLLVWAFVKKFQKRLGKDIESIPKKSMQVLQSHSWPGNVRELKNLIERAMILSNGRTLDVHVPERATLETDATDTLEEMERMHILAILEKTGWRIAGPSGAAEVLGLKRTTLQAKMKKLGINRPNT